MSHVTAIKNSLSTIKVKIGIFMSLLMYSITPRVFKISFILGQNFLYKMIDFEYLEASLGQSIL